MKLANFIIVPILIVLGISVWIDLIERKAETIFSSEGIQILVLEAEVEGGLIKIVEPNGELSLFSDQMKREELMKIAERQKTLMNKVDYFYHRLKRFVKKKLDC